MSSGIRPALWGGMIALFFGVGIVGVLCGSWWGMHRDHPHIFGKEFRMGSPDRIHPLLECETNEASSSKRLMKLRTEVMRLLDEEKKKGQIIDAAVYVRLLDDGTWMGINEEEEFRLASLKKIPLLIAYLKKEETESDYLERKYMYNGTFDSDDMANIKSAQPLESGKEYVVEDLLKRMIEFSDNNSAVILASHLDESFLKSVYQDLGVEVDESAGEQRANVKEYSKFFRILYNASYLSRDASRRALDILEQTKYTDGLVAGVPKGVEIAHKFGERVIEDEIGQTQEAQLHDCGIVYAKHDHYFICVMTRGKVLEPLHGVIRRVSEKVYSSLEDSL